MPNRIHNVVVGDRITNLSIKYYGTGSKTATIVNGNPQLKGRPISLEGLPTIYPGDILNIPEETANIVNFPEKKTFPDTVPVTTPDQISFLINDKTFNYFNEYDLNESLDSLDSIGFSSPFDETQSIIKTTFEAFSYQDIGIYYNGLLQFGGTSFPISESNPESKTFSVVCYPKCGVLNDCDTPISLYPIEFENQNLEQIANTFAQPFGIEVIFDSDPGNAFTRTAPEPDQNILNYLIELGKQRGLLLSNTPQGNLLFWKADIASDSVANIKEGERPFISCVPTFDQQSYYSHITGFLPTKNNKDSEKYTWENPFLKSKGVLRPMSFILEDSESSDLKSAVEQKAGRMFGAVCSYVLTLQGHRDQNGNLYTKNTTINLLASGAMIYKDTKFLIKNVKKSRTPSGGDETVMNIVLPGSYSGIIPTEVPWEL